jgi:hypothetical protein
MGQQCATAFKLLTLYNRQVRTLPTHAWSDRLLLVPAQHSIRSCGCGWQRYALRAYARLQCIDKQL